MKDWVKEKAKCDVESLRYKRRFEKTNKTRYEDKMKYYESMSNSYDKLMSKTNYKTTVDNKSFTVNNTNNKSTSIANGNKFSNKRSK